MFFIYRSFITNFYFFDVSFFPRMWNRKLEDEVDSPTKVSDSRKLEPDADNFSRSGGIQAKKTSEGTPQCLATPNMVKISLACYVIRCWSSTLKVRRSLVCRYTTIPVKLRSLLDSRTLLVFKSHAF